MIFGRSIKCLMINMVVTLIAANTFVYAEEQLNDGLPASINVKMDVSDKDISQRIKTILLASGWFEGLSVNTSSGIVSLTGVASTKGNKEWAEKISYRTQHVIAVVNKIEIADRNPWSLEPIKQKTLALIEQSIEYIPTIIIGIIILLVTYFLAKKLSLLSRRLILKRVESVMLRNLLAKLISTPIVIVGVYLVFSVSGLGSLATTLISGTGLIGLIIGIAFRDITENFLASILLSIQRPFVLGDMIQVLEYTGMVEAMTTRGTIIITLDGNHVQIPNTTIYKQPITNLTANPNIRQYFSVGIGYDAPISKVQTLILNLLEQHNAVLNDPEPLILAEELASSTVVIGIYFWVDSTKHSAQKVRSSVIRKVKFMLMSEGISMPDDAREIIFPQGIDVNLPTNDPAKKHDIAKQLTTEQSISSAEIDEQEQRPISKAEGDLSNEIDVLKEQAKNATLGENKTNLL